MRFNGNVALEIKCLALGSFMVGCTNICYTNEPELITNMKKEYAQFDHDGKNLN